MSRIDTLATLSRVCVQWCHAPKSTLSLSGVTCGTPNKYIRVPPTVIRLHYFAYPIITNVMANVFFFFINVLKYSTTSI